MKKLKAEIGRLRLDLVNQGSKKRRQDEEENSDDSDLDENHRVALKMLPQD